MPPRRDHYLFAHHVLRELFFIAPEALLTDLTGRDEQRVLARIWDQAAEDLPRHIRTPVALFETRHLRVAGRTATLIRLPTPVAPPEAHFVALIAASEPDEARYFTLERTAAADAEPPDEMAVLGEWLDDGRRRSYGPRPAECEAFVQAIERELAEEDRRRDAGVRPATVGAWDPAGDEGPDEAWFEQGSFRPHPCLFAFHTFPDRVLGRDFGRLAEPGQATRRVAWAWSDAAEICMARLGQTPPPADAPGLEFLDLAGTTIILVTMPEPLSPPEPLMLALPLGAPKRLLLLELVSSERNRALVTAVYPSGEHAILGLAQDRTREAFLACVGHVLAGRRVGLDQEHPFQLERQIVLYVELASRAGLIGVDLG